MIRFYPRFEARLRQSLATIIGADTEHRVEIRVANDEMAIGGRPFPLYALFTD